MWQLFIPHTLHLLFSLADVNKNPAAAPITTTTITTTAIAKYFSFTIIIPP